MRSPKAFSPGLRVYWLFHSLAIFRFDGESHPACLKIPLPSEALPKDNAWELPDDIT